MARKTGAGTGIVLILCFGWLISKCGGSGSSTTIDPASFSPPTAIYASSIDLTETMFVDAAALNQRSAHDGLIVSKIPGGESVNIYERRGSWARVSPDNAAPLWVSGSHLCSGAGCYSPEAPRSRGSTPSKKSQPNYFDSSCPCSGRHVCIGPRGGRYCITSGGNKRYGV